VSNRKRTGNWAEQHACSYLRSQGLRLVEKNYSAPCGELDLVMQQEDTLVFVEVRYRADDRFGGALESINSSKVRKLINTAEHFLQRYRRPHSSCRFDAVLLSGRESVPRLEWIQDAFQT
jgi:putative endonuclease